MRSRRVLLCIGGGIAAYKSLELIRRLRDEGVEVVVAMTPSAEEFVTPLSVSALAGGKVFRELFDLGDEAEMGHIQLSRAADLVVVAPATADLMAKMAGGHADDLVSTLLMATDTPVMVVPSMNVRMWEHPATQRNLAVLRGDGITVVGPDEGPMACGEFGPGRMAEVPQIVAAIRGALTQGPLAGRKILVTSGPTHEPIDPVRYIANRSSGAQGTAIAEALVALGADVVFVTGPAAAARPAGCEVVEVETADQMLNAVTASLPADVAIFAAAVADWHVTGDRSRKIKKTADGPRISFAQNPDILAHVAQMQIGRPGLVIGFAAETDDVLANAAAKRDRKGCDWILANDVRPQTGIMGGEENDVTLITQDTSEDWPRMSKRDVGMRLARRIADTLTHQSDPQT